MINNELTFFEEIKYSIPINYFYGKSRLPFKGKIIAFSNLDFVIEVDMKDFFAPSVKHTLSDNVMIESGIGVFGSCIPEEIKNTLLINKILNL